MKNATILYPGGVYDNPTTGGQVYDYRLFGLLSKNGVNIKILDDSALGRKKGESVFWLPIRLISRIEQLASNEILVFNTALFPYYIIPLFLLRLFYPKIRIFGIHHHFRFQEQSGVKSMVYKFLEFINLKQCDKVICPCPYTRDVLLNNWKKGRVVMLENSFDISSKETSSYDEFKLLYVGSIYERKGIIYLLDAIAKFDDEIKEKIHLDIVGNIDKESDYVKMLIKFVSDNNLKSIVTFTGRVKDEILKKYYSKAYAFILPSLLEGYGLVIVEAMSYGLPVIAFDNSAMPYTIKHEKNGLLTPNKDSEALKNNILRLILDKKLHTNLAMNAKKYSLGVHSLDEYQDDIKAFIRTWQ